MQYTTIIDKIFFQDSRHPYGTQDDDIRVFAGTFNFRWLNPVYHYKYGLFYTLICEKKQNLQAISAQPCYLIFLNKHDY